MVKAAIFGLLLCLILLLAFWIRTQGVERLPPRQFTETDAYLYHWQARIIAEKGHLPERDMHRWLPLGRDNRQTLNLYSYALAYIHKAVLAVFPKVMLYHVSVYMPVVCFCVGLAALCLYLYEPHGVVFTISVGVLLATLPGSIERSGAGFGDRDAWCLMLGILSLTMCLASLQAPERRKRIFWTLASGFCVFLGGLSWEGFGVLLSIIMLVEIWRFLTSETEEELGLYLLWVCTFVPPLYLVSPAYRSGYGFAKHLAALMLVPPLVLFGIRYLRHLLITTSTFANKLRPHARRLAVVFTLVGIAIGLGYVLIHRNTFDNTTVPLSQNALMQVVPELESPGFGYWVFRYGSVFLLGSLGFVVIPVHLWGKQGYVLSISLMLFTLSTFFREPLEKISSVSFGNAFFGIALVYCAIALGVVAWKRCGKNLDDRVYIAFCAWYLLWVALSRDAKRYDFFIGVALAFGTAALIQLIAQTMSEKLQQLVGLRNKLQTDFKSAALRTGVCVILLPLLMWLPQNAAHTTRAIAAAKEMRPVKPVTPVAKAFEWMNAKLPDTAVVAANWSYGSQLNVLAGVKTITDQDTYLQHWIHLYYKHIIAAKTEREALEFLFAHGATHLMLVGYKPAKFFLPAENSSAFLPAYPTQNFLEANVNVWALEYPPDVKTNPKYLKTGFPEIDADLDLR